LRSSGRSFETGEGRTIQERISYDIPETAISRRAGLVGSCKECGEIYVLRDVNAGEVLYPKAERLPYCSTGIEIDYRPDEFEVLWAS
jgi:hypothetical protein